MDRPEPAQGASSPTSTSAEGQGSAQDNFRVQAPSVSLPKGGGAIKGIGEKFAANPVTGTGSMSIPIATSPGRAGFGPQLGLSYDSGAGNGPFGFGWSLSLPSVTRKTDKGLPRYNDFEESDVFVLSGAEDLVPVLENDGQRHQQERTVDGVDYVIHRYRPRIEGLFARIERWTKKDDGDVFWRSISKDNIITWYGKDENSRIADPVDPRRIFSWLICESRDDKGNGMHYDYAEEDSRNVDLALANERNRTVDTRKAQRYLKTISYGNRTTLLDAAGQRPTLKTRAELKAEDWMFQAVFDYGDHPVDVPLPLPSIAWPCRRDPYSSHRSSFEVRTYRLCQRVLMFHHFPGEAVVGANCLVRSTDFIYRNPSNDQVNQQRGEPVASFITAVTQSGYKRSGAGYLKRSMPPVEFTYSEVEIDSTVQQLDAESMENLPVGIDGGYQLVDLDGEGISGVLTEQADAWYYKPPLGDGKLGPMTAVAKKPNMVLAGGAQLLDLNGNGQLDLTSFRGPVTGFYERTDDADWETLRAFRTVPNIAWDDPNLRFVDVNGDGHADVLITEHQAITWYPSIAEKGFDPAERVTTPFDEERGPALVFADGTQSIYLADLCGDGLTDLLRIRNGEVCYWPNLGYGRFGAKVTTDNAPWFDHPDQFDQKRVRIADIDGSGTIDILYLAADRVRVFLNQSGNAFKEAPSIAHAFPMDNIKNVSTADILGKGTACLVWTSSLPGDARAPMKFIDLMKNGKPHLLIKSENNLGAETVVTYVPSTHFYLKDKAACTPWITRLAFPVHVVERVETYDRISRNRFVTRYAYHHGYFDGVEREFRGFGMVEQWDTEEFAALSNSDVFPVGDNIEEASHVPPMHTKTWFHTGAYSDAHRITRQYAQEYFREPGMNDAQFEAQLLPDTTLPTGLSAEEEREAVRSLKGSILRQEVYADDGSPKALLPYSVSERNYTIKQLQPRGANKHGVFFMHASESIDFHYERNTSDPRIGHSFTLAVDDFGNVLKAAAVGYGRHSADPTLTHADQENQARIHATYTGVEVTMLISEDDVLRTPMAHETRSFELAGLKLQSGRVRFTGEEYRAAFEGAALLPYEVQADYVDLQKRLIEHVRTVYRSDDLDGTLPPGECGPLAIPFEAYRLALTPALVTSIYGDRVTDAMLADEGRYMRHTDGNWWLSSGRMRFIADSAGSPAEELAEARTHFYLTRLVEDPFGSRSTVQYDAHDLLLVETRDALDNRMTIGERRPDGTIDATVIGNDYRVLQPCAVMDANRNRSQVAFDVLGLVAGSAVMGKPEENKGDSLAGFEADLSDVQVAAHFAAPLSDPWALLQGASYRIVYDPFAYQRTKADAAPSPVPAGTIVRETHRADENGTRTKVQVSFAFSDGFGRAIQQKVQAEAGPVSDGGPDISPRWVGNGWAIFNNKGKPVRQYEPFFSATSDFEFAVITGVSPVLFYDPADRVICTLNPDHTWAKVLFDPWLQATWDASDLLRADPLSDPDVGMYFRSLPLEDHQPTWYALRTDAAHAALFTQQFPDPTDRANETAAAQQSEVHANTFAQAHADSLGRSFLTVARNRYERDATVTEEVAETRVVMDMEGNEREVIDALGRMVVRYDYDMLGTRVHQASMEAGQRWMLNDCMGKPFRSWDERGHGSHTTYDGLHRPVANYVQGADPARPNDVLMVDRATYGDTPETGLSVAQRETLNLRGQAYRQCDQAGVVTNESFDFKGQLTGGTRQFTREYKRAVDWTLVHDVLGTDPNALDGVLLPMLEADVFRSSSEVDALGRPITITMPDNSALRPRYNEANLLEGIAGNVRGNAAETVFVRNIDYDAKGQREAIVYGNGVRTGYHYDPLTFRLRRLISTRDPQPVEERESAGWPGSGLQDLHYTYDPAGNITHIRDTAQQTIFFKNKRVEPSNEYTYDALNRLNEAHGREQLGQANAIIPLSHDDSGRHVSAAPSDGTAMGRYRQRYTYDLVGNILALAHKGMDPLAPGWTREYFYEEASLLEPAKVSNRLTRTRLNGRNEPYTHDAHGNMTQMPHLPLMAWDYRDQLQRTAQQIRTDGGTPEITYYVYDGSGQRVRKVTERAANAGATPTRMKERVYLGGAWERYREYANDGSTVDLERESLHVLDDKQRICLVETKTIGDEGTISDPRPLFRYQLSNHLGSAAIEVDDDAQVISYEEFYPYGSTSYQMLKGGGEVSAKRYRYTGMERDEENGLAYHAARYLALWLVRWTAADPSGIEDGTNVFFYVQGNPIHLVDLTGHDGTVAPPNNLPRPSGPWDVDADRLVVRKVQAGAGRWKAPRKTKAAGNALAERLGFDPKTRHLGHDKPYWQTRAGEVTTVRNEPGSGVGNNSSRGATIERPAAARARSAGEFARDVRGNDPMAPAEARRTAGPATPAEPITPKPPAAEPVPASTKPGRSSPHTQAPEAPKGKGLKVGTVVAVAFVVADVVDKLLAGDYPGALESAAVGGASLSPAAPLAFAYLMAKAYHTDPSVKEGAMSDGKAWEDLTGSKYVGATGAALSAVGRSFWSVLSGMIPSSGPDIYRSSMDVRRSTIDAERFLQSEAESGASQEYLLELDANIPRY